MHYCEYLSHIRTIERYVLNSNVFQLSVTHHSPYISQPPGRQYDITQKALFHNYVHHVYILCHMICSFILFSLALDSTCIYSH